MLLRKRWLTITVALGFLSACVIALAASTATTSIAVTASVTQTCGVSLGSALAFGAYDPSGTNATAALNGTGSVSVACTKGSTSLTIGMSNGGNYSGGSRRMKGAVNTEYLNYAIYQPPDNTPGTACTFPGTTVWDTTTTLTLATAPSKAARTYNVCGTVAAGQDVPADSYSDTVTATINF